MALLAAAAACGLLLLPWTCNTEAPLPPLPLSLSNKSSIDQLCTKNVYKWLTISMFILFSFFLLGHLWGWTQFCARILIIIISLVLSLCLSSLPFPSLCFLSSHSSLLMIIILSISFLGPLAILIAFYHKMLGGFLSAVEGCCVELIDEGIGFFIKALESCCCCCYLFFAPIRKLWEISGCRQSGSTRLFFFLSLLFCPLLTQELTNTFDYASIYLVNSSIIHIYCSFGQLSWLRWLVSQWIFFFFLHLTSFPVLHKKGNCHCQKLIILQNFHWFFFSFLSPKLYVLSFSFSSLNLTINVPSLIIKHLSQFVYSFSLSLNL